MGSIAILGLLQKTKSAREICCFSQFCLSSTSSHPFFIVLSCRNERQAPSLLKPTDLHINATIHPCIALHCFVIVYDVVDTTEAVGRYMPSSHVATSGKTVACESTAPSRYCSKFRTLLLTTSYCIPSPFCEEGIISVVFI